MDGHEDKDGTPCNNLVKENGINLEEEAASHCQIDIDIESIENLKHAPMIEGHECKDEKRGINFDDDIASHCQVDIDIESVQNLEDAAKASNAGGGNQAFFFNFAFNSSFEDESEV